MIQDMIEKKLQASFSPQYLEVLNESNMHNVPPGSESHFKVVIVSDEFDGKRLIMRHRAVNTVLAEELSNHIHALSIHTYTKTEWEVLTSGIPASPKCAGGGK
ncbi:transcriptional regulator BolA [Vibrio hibernica]|uniref:transcriptional regulator BolA n=1 Tax=Vibrio hibernica TaxID=2587465 RepID=UPI001882D6A6|nr:transcriptional regulator BolA [Vibrio hibernica]